MPDQHHHLSDHDLLLALDGELPSRHQVAAEVHLVECASCRARGARVERVSALVATVYRSDSLETAPERIHTSREQLRAKLAALARREKSATQPLATALVRIPRWAMVGAAILATVLLVRVVERFETANARPTDASIEEGALPVTSLTPGATWNVTVNELCAPGRPEQRPVSEAIRYAVVRDYGMEHVPADEYELDYLITPELGGAPTPQNLWPQRYASRTWNAHVKDQLERLLPKLVCAGEITLQSAQRDIAVDWIAAYKRYFKTDIPLQLHAHLGADSAFQAEDEDTITYPVWRSESASPLRLISLSRVR